MVHMPDSPPVFSPAAGFADPVFDSQRTFRQLLDALAQPGVIHTLTGAAPVAALYPASVAIGLTLLDFETRLWLDPAVRDRQTLHYFSFHCNCPLVEDCAKADFAIVTNPFNMPELQQFMSGSDEYPDRSTTLIVQVPALRAQSGLRLHGPGIEDYREIAIDGLPDVFWRQLQESRQWFPRGVDAVFTQAERVVALPRTTQFAF
jgi:alpha-D-ribose 1-methylphosphonate 5-triphosphate synthase subunit PhnH